MSSKQLIPKASNKYIVTISFIKFKGLEKLWALKEMQGAKYSLKEIPGLQFFKLMGSNEGNSFSLKPDFSTYSLLAVWKNINYGRNFFRYSKVVKKIKISSSNFWTIYMQPLSSRGTWGGKNPFLPFDTDENYSGPIAVLTRSTIAPLHVFSFWNSIPGVSEMLTEQDGLIFSKSMGEFPVFQQASFSIWEDKKSFNQFSNLNEEHKTLLGRADEKNWYNETLVSELRILESEGSWGNVHLNLLNGQEGPDENLKTFLKKSL